MASLNGADEAQPAAVLDNNAPEFHSAGALGTIQEEAEDDGDMVGPAVPRARKRRVSASMKP